MLDSLETLMRQSHIFNLAQPMSRGMPVYPFHVPYCFSLNSRHGDQPSPSGIGWANDMIVTSGHSGTHIDAIGHFSKHGKLYGAIDVLSNQTGHGGLAAHGIETTPPVLRRAILLDVAAFKDVDVLGCADAISGADLQGTARMEGIQLRQGDVVFVRTGWARYWDDPAKSLGLETGTPGPDLDGATWMVERRASLVGSDTGAFERSPGRGVVHSYLLVENGIQIVENLNLEELARERVYSFMLFIAPLRIVGGTASPISPVAISFGG